MAITNSIVDYLNSIGQDSSYSARKKLAADYGITGYSGTAAQNTSLLAALQSANTSSQDATTTTETTPKESVSENVKAGTDTSSFQKSQSTSDYQTKLQSMESNSPSAYEESNRVSDYYERLQEAESSKPDAYQSQYEEEISSILDSILNNKDFSYTADDLANDDLYQMYRENYTRQGDLAMRDTMGNAAALTGGYGSTYATAAGQQVYDNYLSQLNDKALEFADRAYEQYLNEQTERYNQLNAVTGLDNTDYSRYRDDISDYYTDLNYLANRYDSEYSKDYGQYRDNVSDYYTDRDYLASMYDTEYGHDMTEYQSDLAQKQWAEEFAFQKAQADQAQANWQAEMDFQREQYEYQKSRSGSGSYSGSGSSNNSSKTSVKDLDDYTYYDFVTYLQQLKDDGKVGEVEAYNVVEDWYMKGYIDLEDMNKILNATNTTAYVTKTSKGVMS